MTPGNATAVCQRGFMGEPGRRNRGGHVHWTPGNTLEVYLP